MSPVLSHTDPSRFVPPQGGCEVGTALVALSHPVSFPQRGGSWVLISGVYFNQGRMGAALRSPDGKSFPVEAEPSRESKAQHGAG